IQAGLSFLEGLGRVEPLFRFQAVRSMLIRAGLWAALLTGAGVYSLIAEPVVMILAGVLWLRGPQGAPVRAAWVRPPAPIRWRDDVWPLQAPIALSTFTGYLPYGLLVPTAYAFLGPVPSGQLGMTMALVTALSGGAFAFVSPRIPRMAMAAARGEAARVGAEMRRVILLAGGVYMAGAVLAVLGLIAAIRLDVALTARLADPLVFSVLAAALGLRLAGELLRVHTRTWQSDALWPAALVDLGAIALILPAAQHSLYALAGAFFAENLLFGLAAVWCWQRWMAQRWMAQR
ncbi:MAG: hypothetical protein AAFV53_29370, partial [Myxococcota bacterium]